MGSDPQGKAGLVERPTRGHYTITERGRQVLLEHPKRVDLSVFGTFSEYLEFRAIRHEKQEDAGSVVVSTDVSPSEAIGTLVEDSNAALAADLLERVLAQPPVFLETLALRLLAAMGYGGRESLLEHTGQSGDAGLDDLVRQDAHGLDLIGMQAKRYDPDNPVQRPALQGFVGALQGAQTNRGIFVITGRFTQGARHFAESVAMQLVLIDGAEPTRLMATADDLVAVTFLSVRVGPLATHVLLEEHRSDFSEILEMIGPDHDLADESEEIPRGWPAWELDKELTCLPDVGPTIASKLIARKRPRLVPVYDSVVRKVLGTKRDHCEPIRMALPKEDHALHNRLLRLRKQAGLPQEVSVLRVLDVIAWMEGTHLDAVA